MENSIKAAQALSQPVAPRPIQEARGVDKVSSTQVAAEIAQRKTEASQVIASSVEEVKQAAESLRLNVQRVEPALKISIDDAVDIPIVTVVDQSSNKVIRQIPNEEVVALAKFMASQNFDDYGSMNDAMGMLLNRQV
jgi:flagellar protein FlaG